MKIKAYDVIRQVVEEGAARGVRLAHKHVDAPSKDDIEGCVVDCVMVALSEVVDFEDQETEVKGKP